MEITAVYFNNRMKHINTLYGLKSDFNTTTGSKDANH